MSLEMSLAMTIFRDHVRWHPSFDLLRLAVTDLGVPNQVRDHAVVACDESNLRLLVEEELVF
jgi:hypothetical protein